MSRTRPLIFAAIAGASIACALAPAARALPPPSAPTPGPRIAATPAPVAVSTGPVLPYGSPIDFVLDDKVNSGSTAPGTVVHMHLRVPLVLGGTTVALGGTPATFTVVNTSKAQIGDVDGAIQIHLDPLALPGGRALPIRAYHEYLTIEMTAGQIATRGTTDTIADVFVPYHQLYHALRKGHQMVLPPGTILRAETDATLDATHPNALVIATPPPFVSSGDAPHADITAAPFYTPAPMRPRPLPRGKPTLPPKPSPSPSTVPSGAGSASAAASAQPAAASALPAAPASASPAAAASPAASASPIPSPSPT